MEDWDGYLQCIRVLDAQERLGDLDVVSFPNLKKKARANIAKKYRKDASMFIPKKKLTMKEAMEKLGNLGGRR